MLRDIRHSARLFGRSPAFSVTLILTLALGIGLTTAVFSVVYGVLLRPRPYFNPSALVIGSSVSSVHERMNPPQKWPRVFFSATAIRLEASQHRWLQ